MRSCAGSAAVPPSRTPPSPSCRRGSTCSASACTPDPAAPVRIPEMLAIAGFRGCAAHPADSLEQFPHPAAAEEAPLSAPAPPTARERRRWTRYLVNERAEARVYRELAQRRSGEEREILLALADAEGRHEQHWLTILGGEPASLPRASFRTR